MTKGMPLVVIALASGPAFGCGYCIEDKVAAAYDHALVAQTGARGHEIVFLGYELTKTAGGDDTNSIRRAIEGVPGVDRGSVRVAAESGALAVAFDPKRVSRGKLVAAVDRQLAPLGVETTLLGFGDPALVPGTVAAAPAPPPR